MGTAALLPLAFALLAFCAAAFNAWIYIQRRSEPAHLWLSITAIGVAGIAVTQSMGFGVDDIEEAMRWQRIGFLCAVPMAVGFLRFTVCFLGVTGRAYQRLCNAAVAYAAFVAICSLVPGLIFDATSVRRIPVLGQEYIQASFTPFGQLCLTGFLGVLASTLLIYWARRDHVEKSPLLFVAVCLWIGTGVNDVAVAMGLYRAPLLMSLGYVGFAMAFTALLIRRFVESLDEVAQFAGNLQTLVDRRSEELREKDLQVAHGERMATLGTLAAGVAHEINNPAAYVTSSLNRLEEIGKNAPPPLDAELSEIISECQEGVERIRAIVAELLTHARRGEGSNAPVDLRDVVESTLLIVQHEARRRVELVTGLHEVPPVLGDPRLLGQVVLNLVLNAIQAFPSDRAATENRVFVETSFQDDSVWLVVRDNAGGIAPELLPRIFEPFFTTKPEDEGTGLGLAVTRQLVTRHRGRIDVQSDPTGTTVVVELPPSQT